jgi:hypothetical protein
MTVPFKDCMSSSLVLLFFTALASVLRSLSTASILSDVADLYKAFCFRDEAASQFCTPEERYHFLSDDECICSFLACVKFIHGADPVTHEPIFGKPVLTVIHALAVALAGKSISGEEAWPDAPFLSPLGWQKPTGLLYPFAGSVAVSSREFSSHATTVRPSLGVTITACTFPSCFRCRQKVVSL